MDEQTPAQAAPTYTDEDLVYVDPLARIVVGMVEWHPNGKAKSLAIPHAPTEKDDDAKPGRKPRIRFYPWGTYRSMKRLYKLEGKSRDEKPMLQLDDAIAKAVVEPFWD